MIFVPTGGKTRRVCAALMVVLFLTLAVCIASMPPDKLFAKLSPQNRVDSIIRALEIIDGKGTGTPAPRSQAMRAWPGSGHCASITFIPRAGEREPVHDFTMLPASRPGGVNTATRE